MSKVIFNYQGIKTTIQCSKKQPLKEIAKSLLIKIEIDIDIDIDIDNAFFLYNGEKINKELKFEDLANKEDKERNIMEILLIKGDKNIENKNIIRPKDIICPKCFENIMIKINKYKVDLIECKNGHKINNISIKEFDNGQRIDISKIICYFYKTNNKANIFKNEMYYCLTCEKNICPLCKSIHDQSHKIVIYENKNYFCNKHKETFIKYCKTCNNNICMKCEKEHKKHENIYL